jgi:IS30 family transposase
MPRSHLTAVEREVIDRMYYAGESQGKIATELGRSKSVISRELKRNRDPSGNYTAREAGEKAAQRRVEAKSEFIHWYNNPRLYEYVTSRLRQDWSPEQICGRLSLDHPDDVSMSVSHESIYAWIKCRRRQGEDWHQHLRFGGRRRKRYGAQDLRSSLPDRPSIEARPEEANNRSRCGDWEGDTMEGGKKSGYFVTLADRKSRFLKIRVVDNKRAATVKKAIVSSLRSLSTAARHSLTMDNGTEFAEFKAIGTQLGMKMYFAHPYSSWERGTNENTNGLVRQYFPKGLDLKNVTPAQLAHVERKLNNRPRKCLAFQTPTEVFSTPN